MNGWIKLHRDLLSEEWEWFGNANTTYLFMCLVILANHKEGNWRGTKIKRGSFITGRKKLSKLTGLTERNIRTSLNKLISTSKVTSKTTNKYSVISINNYDRYQQSDQQNANNRPATDQQPTTNKNDKKNKNDKNIYSSVDYLKEKANLEQVAGEYSVRLRFVEDLAGDLILYCQSKGKKYFNYKAALQNWIRRRIREDPSLVMKPDKTTTLPELTPEEKRKADERLQEIRSRFKNTL